MSNRLRSYVCGLATATAMIAPVAFATPVLATDLTITCRCVIGGVNSAGAEWISRSQSPAE